MKRKQGNPNPIKAASISDSSNADETDEEEEEDPENVKLKAAANRMRDEASSSSAAFLQGKGVTLVDRSDLIKQSLPVGKPGESQNSEEDQPSHALGQKADEEERKKAFQQEQGNLVVHEKQSEGQLIGFDQKYRNQAYELLHILMGKDEFKIEGSLVYLKGNALSIALKHLFEVLLIPNTSVSLEYHPKRFESLPYLFGQSRTLRIHKQQ